MGFACDNLGKMYASRGVPVAALEGVDLVVGDGEFVCIVGPSGCGKSTLLRILAGLVSPTTGSVAFDTPAPADRPRAALVFQEHGLFPWMTVLDNVAFGLEMRGVGRKERREAARDFVATLGLDTFANHYPHELSVGMRQRVGIARAFLADTQALLMDEPLGALDAQTKRVLRDELLRIWEHHRKQVVYVTHDIEESLILADRVVVMTGRPGRIREDISIGLSRPRDPEGEEGAEMSRIKRHIWKMLEEEVRKGLCVSA